MGHCAVAPGLRPSGKARPGKITQRHGCHRGRVGCRLGIDTRLTQRPTAWRQIAQFVVVSLGRRMHIDADDRRVGGAGAVAPCVVVGGVNGAVSHRVVAPRLDIGGAAGLRDGAQSHGDIADCACDAVQRAGLQDGPGGLHDVTVSVVISRRSRAGCQRHRASAGAGWCRHVVIAPGSRCVNYRPAGPAGRRGCHRVGVAAGIIDVSKVDVAAGAHVHRQIAGKSSARAGGSVADVPPAAYTCTQDDFDLVGGRGGGLDILRRHRGVTGRQPGVYLRNGVMAAHVKRRGGRRLVDDDVALIAGVGRAAAAGVCPAGRCPHGAAPAVVAIARAVRVKVLDEHVVASGRTHSR